MKPVLVGLAGLALGVGLFHLDQKPFKAQLGEIESLKPGYAEYSLIGLVEKASRKPCEVYYDPEWNDMDDDYRDAYYRVQWDCL